jgi:asparagine synthase (glutamine-hydrolysing)
MCGVAGFLDPRIQTGRVALIAAAEAMAGALVHRGPDAGGVWADEAAGLALGHRRLSIIDLSAAGAQPMVSHSGRYVLVFNGEIYNFAALRSELEAKGARMQGHSDTEVLIEACEAWGVEAALRRTVGMFAFALWDRRERRLVLARDRLGEKPLYYGWAGGHFLFGSELKALRAAPGWEGTIDRQALLLFLRNSFVPAPLSIYEGVRKLPPGTWLELRAGGAGGLAPGSWPEPQPYWSLEAAMRAGAERPFAGSEAEAVDALEQLLGQAVEAQMVADVPLGAFLSGGIDSSTVVALMQSRSSRPVHTFTIGFREHGFDEAVHARQVADHLGTDHTELYVSWQDTLSIIPQLPTMYDEPFADASQVPTHIVARLARQRVTVALSGDGGDELFGGYTRYSLGARLWRAVGGVPLPARRLLGRGIAAVPPWVWRGMGQRGARVGDRAHKAAGVLAAPGLADVQVSLMSHWPDPSGVVRGARMPEPPRRPAAGATVEAMMVEDTLSYLPDDILVKVDRAAMAVSLETRVPLLDHRIVEFAWSLPLPLRVRGGTGKWLLRQLLHRHVPRSLVERPKMGFGVPIADWLRGPLRGWAEDLLATDSLAAGGLLEPAPIRERWTAHASGARNWQYALWNVLMFQAWRDAEGRPRPAAAPRLEVVA